MTTRRHRVRRQLGCVAMVRRDVGLTAPVPELVEDLDRLVDPVTRGDPESPLRWTCKSVRRLAEELRRQGASEILATLGG